jgi:hypothetical protein
MSTSTARLEGIIEGMDRGMNRIQSIFQPGSMFGAGGSFMNGIGNPMMGMFSRCFGW